MKVPLHRAVHRLASVFPRAILLGLVESDVLTADSAMFYVGQVHGDLLGARRTRVGR
jgi:hypothetical protein